MKGRYKMKTDNSYEDAAENIAGALCEKADRQGWIYEKRTTEGVTSFIFQVPGKPWTGGIWVSVDSNGGILEMASLLLKGMAAEKRAEAAVIVNTYNMGNLLGMLEMDIRTGEVWYKIKLSIAGCREQWINWEDLMDYVSTEAKLYRNLLMQLNIGGMTVSQILQQMKQQ